MVVDEDETWKLKKYGKCVTKTDHNTILVQFEIDGEPSKKENVPTRYNLRNPDARERMKENIESNGSIDEIFVDNESSLDSEIMCFMKIWDDAIKGSFSRVKPSKNRVRCIDSEIKALLKEEGLIRKNEKDSIVKGRKIAELQQRIGKKIAANLTEETERKIREIVLSNNPQSKVFSVRRREKMNCNIDFPLCDFKKHCILPL